MALGAIPKLSDAELASLDESNTERLFALNRQGVQVAGIAEKYLVLLVERLLTPERIAEVRTEMALYTADQLDRVEEQVRQQKLLGGLGR